MHIDIAQRISAGSGTTAFVSVDSFGAVGDGQQVGDGAMNGTTGVLTSASGKFTAAAVGKWISVRGAGASGAMLVTTIASYQSTTQVTLAAVSATSVSGATVLWGTDNSPAFQRALDTVLTPVSNSATTGGGIMFTAGKVYLLATSPGQIYPAIPDASPLVLRGYGATILLTTICQQFVVIHQTADYQTFQNVSIAGFTVDATGITSAFVTGGLIIGGGARGFTRANWKNFEFIDLRGFAAPSQQDSTRVRVFIFIISYQASHGASEPITNTITNIHIRNMHFEGAEQGTQIAGLSTSSSFTDNNFFVDDIEIDGFWHDTLTVPTTFATSNHVQIGGNAPTGRVLVRNVFGRNAGDDGIEIDNADFAIIEDCEISGAYTTEYLITNFSAMPNAASQVILLKNCRAIHTITAYNGSGFVVSNNNSVALGTINFVDCSVYKPANSAGNGNADGISMSTLIAQRVSIMRFDYSATGIVWTTGAVTHVAMRAQAAAGQVLPVDIQGMRINVAATISGGTYQEKGFDLGTNATGTVLLHVRDLDYAVTLTGGATGSVNCFNIGSGIQVAGSIEGLRVLTCVPAAQQIILFGSPTIPTGKMLSIDNCDFTVIAGANPVNFNVVPGPQAQVRWTDPARNSGFTSTAVARTAQTGVDRIIKVTASSQSITLPTAGSLDWPFTIKNAAGVTGTTVVGTIDGATNYSLAASLAVLRVFWDGTAWFTA